MKITWTRCRTYDAAKNFTRVIYLHEWNAKPFYWGKAHRSYFGGNRRKRGKGKASGRYASGYRHWIEACLQNGAALYVGKLNSKALRNINRVESFLMHTYKTPMNTVRGSKPEITVKHAGDVPKSIRRRAARSRRSSLAR